MEEKSYEATESAARAPEARVRLSFDTKDRILLLPALIIGYMFVELLRGLFSSAAPALGAFAAAALLVALTAWYASEKRPLKKGYLPLLAAAGVSALSLALYSQGVMGVLNWAAAPALLFIWALCACGVIGEGGRWTVLIKSFLMSYAIRWKHVDKAPRAVGSLFKGRSLTWVWVLAGVGVSIPLAAAILALLRSADTVFSAVTDVAINALSADWTKYIGRFIGAVCIGILIYSALYSLRRDGAWKAMEKKLKPRVPAGAPIALLCVVDIIYAVFVVVQFAYLFGGAGQLELTGMSYAEYARSGFFELVFIAVLNLTLSMLAVILTDPEGKGAAAVRALAAALLVMTAVILVSAAFRMYMYVDVYGLSVLRAMTIWGIALIAVWLCAAFVKLFRPKTGFFKVLFVSAVAAWALLSACNMNGIIARYNVEGYMSDEIETIDVEYIGGLGPAALPALLKLSASDESGKEPYWSLSYIIEGLSDQAKQECSDWRSWNLQSALMAGK